MADFALWGEAVGRGLGRPDEAFLSAYPATAAKPPPKQSKTRRSRLFCSRRCRPPKMDRHLRQADASLAAAVAKNTAASACWPKSTSLFDTSSTPSTSFDCVASTSPSAETPDGARHHHHAMSRGDSRMTIGVSSVFAQKLN